MAVVRVGIGGPQVNSFPEIVDTPENVELSEQTPRPLFNNITLTLGHCGGQPAPPIISRPPPLTLFNKPPFRSQIL